MKRFTFGERMHFELGGQAFNLFDHRSTFRVS